MNKKTSFLFNTDGIFYRMKKTYAFVCLILCCFFWTASVFAAQIKNIRLAKYQPNIVRLVVETDEKPDAKIFTLSDPARLVVDFKNTYFSQQAPVKIPAVDFIKSVRKGLPDNKTSRLVLELPNTGATENHFNLKPSQKTGWRFVMDIKKNSIPSVEASTTKVPTQQVQPKEAPTSTQKSETTTPVMKEKISTLTKKTSASVPIKKPNIVSAQTNISAPETSPSTTTKKTHQTSVKPVVEIKKKSKKIVVLDPGHGGKDPGAISRSGQYEKNITLAMAKETRKYLEDSGYKVVLTRSTDKAIPLRRRYQIAHEADGDLFISIHADSAKNRSARGLSVYTISERASDKEAAALAERENKADILLGLDLSEYNPDVSNILIDLAKIDTMNKSAVYAKHLVKEMKQETTLLPNAHRFAGFAVLKSANIPSVLLELGYLSNPREDKLLQKKSYRRKLARALVRAVDLYFQHQTN